MEIEIWVFTSFPGCASPQPQLFNNVLWQVPLALALLCQSRFGLEQIKRTALILLKCILGRALSGQSAVACAGSGTNWYDQLVLIQHVSPWQLSPSPCHNGSGGEISIWMGQTLCFILLFLLYLLSNLLSATMQCSPFILPADPMSVAFKRLL